MCVFVCVIGSLYPTVHTLWMELWRHSSHRIVGHIIRLRGVSIFGVILSAMF